MPEEHLPTMVTPLMMKVVTTLRLLADNNSSKYASHPLADGEEHTTRSSNSIGRHTFNNNSSKQLSSNRQPPNFKPINNGKLNNNGWPNSCSLSSSSSSKPKLKLSSSRHNN